MSVQPKTFSYHVAWRTRGRHAGRHASLQRGMGMEFRGYSHLLSYPDPRRIDIRQTIRDPLEQIHVRMFNQKGAIPVCVICDLSGSMRFGNQQTKIELAAEISESIALSASEVHDSFSFIGFDDQVREDWISTASFKPQTALELTLRLKTYQPAATGNLGLLDIARYLPRERSLLFLVSDFHLPLERLQEALMPLFRHHIVPVILWDASEYRKLPEFGIANMIDAESGQRRTLFLRKNLRERILQNFGQRRAKLEALLLGLDIPPFFVENTFDADALTEYFYQFMAA